MTLLALVTMVFRRHNLEVMRQHLYKLSPGRIFTTILRPEMGGMSVSSKQWTRTTGKTVINISGDYPTTTNMGIPLQPIVHVDEKPGKGPRVVETSASDGPSERDQFLGHPQSPPIPRPYGDANRHSSLSLNPENY